LNSAGAGFVSFATRGKIRHLISIAVYLRLKRQRGGAARGLGRSRRVGRFATPRLTHTPRCSCLASPLPKCGGGGGGEGQEVAFGVSREARGC
jgi:hypothetical protein